MSGMDREVIKSHLPAAAWGLSGLVVLLAAAVWGQNVSWQLSGLTTYSWFPLFGLSAFSLMWAHYMVTAARQALSGDAVKLKSYYRFTSWLVLVAILLHPGLLVGQLWLDGFGLPPSSYLTHYVAPELGWVAWLGFFSLLTFLAYETKRWFDRRPWWRWVAWAGEFAMIAIFYHGLRLGGELQVSWFRALWLVYGITLVTAFAYLHWTAYQRQDPEPWRARGMVVGVAVAAVGLAALLSALII